MRDANKFALTAIVIMVVVLFFYSAHSGSRQTMMLNALVSDADFNSGAQTIKFTLIIMVLCIIALRSST